MNKYNHRFCLERYTTPASRHTCPKCGRKRCFTYYIDTQTGKPVDERCGKCDHLSSCGYHLPPREFFGERGGANGAYSPHRQVTQPVTPSKVLLPSELPDLQMGSETLLHSWLEKHFPAERVKKVCEIYRLGQWHDHRVVFWQIDRQGRVHDGKIMDYLPNGHRNPDCPPSWVSAEWRREGKLPQWALTEKCLFGEHLISAATQPDAQQSEEALVCIVESEKSAVYCACRFPQFVWMATGGCKALNERVLRPLKGRHIVFFPDSGMYAEWARVLQSTNGLKYLLHNFDYLPKNADIVDVLSEELACAENAEKPEHSE